MNPNGPPAGGFGGPRPASEAPLPIGPAPAAAPPAPSSPVVPASRRCPCGGAAPCVDVRPARLGLLRLGTRRAHRCGACGQSFAIRGGGHMAFTGAYAIFVTFIGALIVVFPPGSAVGAEADNRIFGIVILVGGLACLAWFVAMVRARLVHPERP